MHRLAMMYLLLDLEKVGAHQTCRRREDIYCESSEDFKDKGTYSKGDFDEVQEIWVRNDKKKRDSDIRSSSKLLTFGKSNPTIIPRISPSF